jgi:hypothetical protein
MKTTIQIDRETHAELKKIAEASRMSLGEVVKFLVQIYRGETMKADYDEEILSINR